MKRYAVIIEYLNHLLFHFHVVSNKEALHHFLGCLWMCSCMEGLGCISSSIPLEQVTAARRLSSEACIILILLSTLIPFKVPLIKMRISIQADYTILPCASSGSTCTVAENQKYVRHSVWWLFLLLARWVTIKENQVQHPSFPPQTLFCAANPKESFSICWQAFICRCLIWSYGGISAFTVTKHNKSFFGNQPHKREVHIQNFRAHLSQSSGMCHSLHNELWSGKDVEGIIMVAHM